MKYIESELVNALPFTLTEENYKTISMQIRAWTTTDANNKTKWFNVTVEQMRKIQQILIEG